MNSFIKNQKGQGLIEYLLLVALMAVGTIGILRVLNHTVAINFANVASALQGQSKTLAHERIGETDVRKKDMGSFMSGSSNRKSGATDSSDADSAGDGH